MWKHAKVGSIMTSEDFYRRLGIKVSPYQSWCYIKTDRGWEKRESIEPNISKKLDELNERLLQGESISIAEIEERLHKEYGFPRVDFKDDIYGLSLLRD